MQLRNSASLSPEDQAYLVQQAADFMTEVRADSLTLSRLTGRTSIARSIAFTCCRLSAIKRPASCRR
jgi:hypothetical protein